MIAQRVGDSDREVWLPEPAVLPAGLTAPSQTICTWIQRCYGVS
jgi:hypothetical protein